MQKLQDAVRNVKTSREMEERYMLLEELLKEEREAGRNEGLEQGRTEGLAQGRTEGLEQGRTEGIALGKAENVLELLSDLGEVPEELREQILGEKELDVLKFYLKKASMAKSIEEFQELIQKNSKGVEPV